MAAHQFDRMLEIAVALLAVLQRAAPEFALALVGGAQRQYHRQRDLAVAEIVADALAELRLQRRIVEHVVDELEGDAEIAAEGFEGLLLGLRAAGDDGADAARRGEELRRLGVDHFEIGGFGGRDVVRGDELQHLAFGDDRRGARQDRQHRQRPVLDHQLESAAEEKIADQHRGLVAPDGIRGGEAAAQIAVVDDIVMQQGGGVDEFDRGGEGDVAIAAIAAEPGGGEGEHRP